ncbi:MAG: universal stress protein [Thermodesulfobacteriota bacterium]
MTIPREKTYASILVALDGSDDSLAGGRLALAIAGSTGAPLRAVHVYDTKIHNTRFREMEPGLPQRYREQAALGKLRHEHDLLMADGFRSLSLGYMEDFLAEADRMGVRATGEAVEGRNYIGLLSLLERHPVDLVVLGAAGLGKQGDGMLGSTALRVLRRASCDVLIARAGTGGIGGRTLLACTDGSAAATAALRRAAALAESLAAELRLFAAYDVEFHKTIFRTMARSLSMDRQRQIGLDRQEAVHEELIDKSLEALYSAFLQAGARELAVANGEVRTCLRPGKAYRAIVDYAGEAGAALVVLARFGHNLETASDIGSHAEAVTRLAPCHVLVCNGGETPAGTSRQGEMFWEEEALRRLERIPAPVRAMARKAIEEQAVAGGASAVTLEVMQAVAGRFGMGEN